MRYGIYAYLWLVLLDIYKLDYVDIWLTVKK